MKSLQFETAIVTDRSHGRSERVTLESTTALNHLRERWEVAWVVRLIGAIAT